MSARVTINLTGPGQLEIWLNEQGRDLLVKELMRLDAEHEHFHLAPDHMGDVGLSTIAYRTDDKILEFGKILFRTDAWDKQYFPHVISD